MAIGNINNTINPINSYQKYTPIGKTAANKETPKNPLIEDKTVNNKNKPLNKTNTENKNISNQTNKPKEIVPENTNTKPLPGLQKDQQQTMNYVNSVQKIPNGMDAVTQSVIQGYKGVNRLA